jgi:hypothetical protein
MLVAGFQRRTMYTPPPFLSISVLLALAGCTGTVDFVPCEEDGTIGNIYYVDGNYQNSDGLVYATAGDRPFELCSIASGQIFLNGVIPHFEDFDPFVEIGGFYDYKYNAPDPPPGIGGGRIEGFPNLKRITKKLRDTSALLGDGPSDGAFYLDGFDQLQFVEGDFPCSGSDNLGTELVSVTGRVGCPQDRLTKLEHAGSIFYKGHPLPSLRTLGELSVLNVITNARFEMPLLEEVGGSESTYSGDFLFGGLSAISIDLSSLRSVHGTFQVMGFRNVPLEVSEEERGGEFRRMFEGVDVGGYRSICNNSSNDPCPYEESCEELHGEGALECCTDPWRECVD